MDKVLEQHEVANDFNWVVEQLQELGFTPRDALALALAGTDWHSAEKLIRKGCSHQLALEILL